MNQDIIAEEWRPIKGYEGLYLASNLGRIKSVRSGKVMSTKKHLRGYPQINFSVKGVRKILYIHRIIAETFLENTSNHKTVDHIDENKKNNKASNLQWCSHKENMTFFHARRVDKKRKEKHMVLSKKDVDHIRKEHACFAAKPKDIAKGYAVSLPLVYKIINFQLWTRD